MAYLRPQSNSAAPRMPMTPHPEIGGPSQPQGPLGAGVAPMRPSFSPQQTIAGRMASVAGRQFGAPGGVGFMGGGNMLRQAAGMQPSTGYMGGAGGGTAGAPPLSTPGQGAVPPYNPPDPGQPNFQPQPGAGPGSFKGSKYLKKAFQNLPPGLQDPRLWSQGIGGIMDILRGGGRLPTEMLAGEQAGIERGRGQARDQIMASLAQAGIDINSPMAQSMLANVDQGGNRLQATARRDEDIRSYMQNISNYSTLFPIIAQILEGYTTKSGGNITPIPQGGGQRPDYAGAIANLGSAAIKKWG